MIEVTGLTKRFGRTVAVDGLSFTVRPGRVTGFLGPNGAGKSTTLRMIVGLDRPDAGRVLVGGRRYHDLEHPLRTVGVTGEHRFGTVRAAYAATPRRWRVLLAKVAIFALIGLVTGTALAFAATGVAALTAPDADFALRTAADWRVVAGVGVSHAVSAAIAVAVGTLLRHAAGAISLLLIWVLVVETTVVFLPIGDALLPLMPFQAQAYFLGQVSMPGSYPPVFGIVYAAAVAALLVMAAVLMSGRRDAG